MVTRSERFRFIMRQILSWHRQCGWIQAYYLGPTNLGLLRNGESFEDFAERTNWVLAFKEHYYHVPDQPETGWNLYSVDLQGCLDAIAHKQGCHATDILLDLEETG